MNQNYLRAIISGTMTLYCGDDTQMGVCVCDCRTRKVGQRDLQATDSNYLAPDNIYQRQ